MYGQYFELALIGVFLLKSIKNKNTGNAKNRQIKVSNKFLFEKKFLKDKYLFIKV